MWPKSHLNALAGREILLCYDADQARAGLRGQGGKNLTRPAARVPAGVAGLHGPGKRRVAGRPRAGPDGLLLSGTGRASASSWRWPGPPENGGKRLPHPGSRKALRRGFMRFVKTPGKAGGLTAVTAQSGFAIRLRQLQQQAAPPSCLLFLVPYVEPNFPFSYSYRAYKISSRPETRSCYFTNFFQNVSLSQ